MLTGTTLFNTKEQAEQVRCLNSNDDPEWTYEVKPRGKYWVIRLFDEFGSPIGYL